MLRRQLSAFVRPAILEVVLVVLLTAVSVLTALAGERIQCTALVEFSILSAITAASSALLLARYVVVIGGFLTRCEPLERWAFRLRNLCYVGLGAYALTNGLLDIALARRDSDPISYPGLLCAVLAVLVVTLVLETKYRVLQTFPSSSLFDSLSDNGFYVTVGSITLIALVAHVFVPAWWLDTLIDCIVVALVALRINGFIAGKTATL